MKIHIRLYDNGGKTADRYTAVAIGAPYSRNSVRQWEAFGFDENPFHPLGIGQHCGAMCGRHLGRRIEPAALPEQARKAFDQFARDYQWDGRQ